MLGIILLVLNVGKFQLPAYIFPLIAIIPLLCETSSLLFTSNCPNCFGIELCEVKMNGGIKLHWLSKVLLMLHPKLTKSVFFGTLNSSRNVVLKSMTRRGQYRVKNYNLTEQEIFGYVIKENVLISDEIIQNVVVCPNVKSLHLLFENVDENVTNLIYTQNLWFDLQISIEPLLLKFLSPIEDMPVPGYCGACGDIIVKEYKGKALNDYYSHKWLTRAFLSVQLLKMAETFTFHHESLIFYFTDISPDNIAVEKSGMIYLTDLDHVIIAERELNLSGEVFCFSQSKQLFEALCEYTAGNSPGKDIIHVSAVLDPIKLTVTPSEVCKYPLSDHNYFTVCKNLLMYSEEMNQGLLSGIPRSVKNHESLEELLEECSHPRKYNNRIIAGKLLKDVLNDTISGFTWRENS